MASPTLQGLYEHSVWQNPPVRLAGLPVVVVGGLTTRPHVLSLLQDWLHRIGCRTLLAPTGYGIDCGQRAAIAVEHALARHTDAIGEQAVIIAHSRGGQFARPVAVRRPELVRGLITLGSPLTRLPGARPPVLLKVLGLGVVGSLGVPGLLRVSCLWGECCRPLRNDLMDLFPSDVPFLSVFSRHDEVVPWESSLDPAARHREICPPIMASSQARWRSNYWPKNSRYKRISALTDLLTLVPLSSTSKFIQQVRKSRAFRGGCA